MAKTYSPDKIAKKYEDNAVASQKEFSEGVKSVDVCPTHLAADKMDKMRAGWLEAFDSGYIEAQLRAVPLAEWKDLADDPAKWIAGIRKKGVPGQKRFWRAWIPILESHKAELATMTDETLEDRLQIMMANARGLAEKKGTWR